MILAIERLAPLVVAIRRFDRGLADPPVGDREARQIRSAVAWGYVRDEDVAPVDRILDRVGAMLHGLGARR